MLQKRLNHIPILHIYFEMAETIDIKMYLK